MSANEGTTVLSQHVSHPSLLHLLHLCIIEGLC